jgi:hypothetical protein
MSLKIFSNVFMLNLPKIAFMQLLNNGYKRFKVLVHNFSLIRLIPNFYDMYIMYSQ